MPEINNASGSAHREWEDLCRRCGRCCFEKVEFRGRVYYTRDPCEFLDLQTRQCRVYPVRSKRRPGCIALTPEVAARGYLPADCPYVARVEDYSAPVLVDEQDDEQGS
ncbi:MAG TPA: hypothetical protein VJ910_05020 [Desulfuromonadales bacterium]|nr:hypothetical protein [Desulfuromonadales bacterium]